MSNKEKLEGNKVGATLFVGLGGIGSKIIREVVDIAKKSNDDLAKAQFVILDTDVNDLEKADDGVSITSIQTSSPRTVRDYLLSDDEAREEWFPNNMIINGKTVSEGAGQIRAISRLALNATIKTGRIKALYDAIDALYNKDGSDKRQTVKVIVSSTIAGGTGSGIALIISMLIRNYLSVNYPDSSAIIRGFFIMPDALQTIRPSTSEELSLQRNGYATLKEINAFMMRPFFESVPELKRYMDLHIDVPNPSGGVDRLQNSPFDFCFLYERTDDSTSKMDSLAQYRSYVAHSIYEQCVGPMSGKAASKEDNIHKEFLDDKKLGRNRFGGAGAAIVRYPYEEIRDYIAYEWIEKQLIGHTSAQVSEDDMSKLVTNSWLVYDYDFHNKELDFKNGNTDTKPQRPDVYVTDIETGSEKFTKMLKEKYIDPKNEKNRNATGDDFQSEPDDADDTEDSARKTSDDGKEDFSIPAVENFINQLIKRAFQVCEATPLKQDTRKDFDYYMNRNVANGFANRLQSIEDMAELISKNNIDNIRKTIFSFVERNFNSNNKIEKNSEPYTIESFLSLDGKALHPNAMRYFLYKLYQRTAQYAHSEPEYADFEKSQDTALYGAEDKQTKKRKTEKFQVGPIIGSQEADLRAMCVACDRGTLITDADKKKCNRLITNYAHDIAETYKAFVRFYVCQAAKPYIERLNGQFEAFYDKFQTKVTGLEKRKATLASKLSFENGDCEYNLFNKREHLQKLADEQNMPAGGSAEEIELFSKIYDAVKENGKSDDILRNDTFADVSVKDVFEDVVVEQYKKIVESWCRGLDMDIVRACGHESRIIALCKAENNPKDAETIIAESKKDINKNAHLAKIIKKGFTLASPSVVRKSFEEDRKIESMSYNAQIEEGDGMKMPESTFNKEFASNNVSKYELHFFRSVYGLTLTDIHKMASPQRDPGKLEETEISVSGEGAGSVGAYFSAYQEYMSKIGPDNRLNPVITPHIDKRWNSITTLPEIDPRGYQRVLMKRIHKAMLYGFIYKRLYQRIASSLDKDKTIYEYRDGSSSTKALTVSNHTKCDRFFEVLDALYFDRYAVHSLHDFADRLRKKEFEKSTPYRRTTFATRLDSIDRDLLVDDSECKEFMNKNLVMEVQKDGQESAEKVSCPVSIFEIPLLYWKSLPKKDDAELDIMYDAIFEIISTEIRKFASADDQNPIIAETLCKHYNLLYANYELCRKLYDSHESSPKDNRAFMLLRDKILTQLDKLDVSRSKKYRLCDHTEDDDLFSNN